MSIESHLESVRIFFNRTLTNFNTFLVKIFNINENNTIFDQRNDEEDRQCIKDDFNADPFDDDWSSPSVDWGSSFDAGDNMEKRLQGLSTDQMISYLQDRYNNSDILPSALNSFMWISLSVAAAEKYIANYNESIPIIITTVSDLEGESFHLGQKLNISTVENGIRNKTISRMKTENETVIAQLSNLKNRQKDELAKLELFRVSQKSLVYDPSFLGST